MAGLPLGTQSNTCPVEVTSSLIGSQLWCIPNSLAEGLPSCIQLMPADLMSHSTDSEGLEAPLGSLRQYDGLHNYFDPA